MLKFAIRDDDTCFFTAPEDLERVYGKIWDRVPISLAVVPFQAGMAQPRVPEEFQSAKKLFPLAENDELVSYLKEGLRRSRLAVMLHGYAHGDAASGYEFRDGRDLARKVREGRRHLEETLKVEISTFVPPHNTFARRGFEAVVDAGLNIAGIPSFRPQVRRWRWADVRPYLGYKWFVSQQKHRPYRYPWPLRLSDHGEVACYGLVPGVTLAQLRAGVDFAHSHDGVFCLAMHYWEVAAFTELHQVLLELVDYALALPGLEPVSVPVLYSNDLTQEGGEGELSVE